MGVSLNPETEAKIEAALMTLKPQIFMVDGQITIAQANANTPMMAGGAPIMLPAGFVNGLIQALKAQRDYSEKLYNLVELIYNEMVD